ncbi:ras-domain-containing protein [Rickenella mellea]|uniref:Ras-domain-containing protein n=1 Tax=Rickenella mellea TaxID=50990 RepID=A0A4Y7Q5R6_9AGAM|nr:ras-domain-containing protein [Rickenella mellea]
MRPQRYNSYDVLIRVGVGKSALLLRFCDDEWTPSFTPTIGVDFKSRTFEIDDNRSLWDTAGQERYRAISNSYYRGAEGIILVYDVTNVESFNNISTWHSDIIKHAPEEVNLILVGNKCEGLEKPLVTEDQGRQLAEKLGIKFIQTSAKANLCVEEAFSTILRDIRKRLIDTGRFPFASGAPKTSTDDLHTESGKLDNRTNTTLTSCCT